MKKLNALLPGCLVIACILLLKAPGAQAQAPAWQSVVAIEDGPGGVSSIKAIAPAANGDAYVAGVFGGTVTLGATTLVAAGFGDVFVAKWSRASNSFVWAQRAGGSSGDEASAIAVSGNRIYITGNFQSPVAQFGGTTLTNASSTNSTDVFVAKLTDAGSSARFEWARGVGSTEYDEGNTIAVNGTNVYIAGSFAGTTATFGSTTLVNAGNPMDPDIFVAKLTDAGNNPSFAWAKRAGNTDGESVNAMAVDGPNLYLTGQFSSFGASFDNITLANANNQGSQDIFVAKLVDAGNSAAFTWAQSAGGTGFEEANTIAVSGASVYVAGEFNGTAATFGATTLQNTNSASSDLFVAKLTDAGSSAGFTWAQKAGGRAFDKAYAMAVQGNSLYLTGEMQGRNVDFGGNILTSAGYDDVFVAKVADLGTGSNFTWVEQVGSAATSWGADRAFALAINGGVVQIGGYLTPPASFGSLTVTRPAADGFLATLGDLTLTMTIPGVAPLGLHPNPARGRVTLQLAAVMAAPSATLTLLDALGRTVRAETVALPAAGLHHELSLAGLAPGIYALHVQAGAATATRRLVVE